MTSVSYFPRYSQRENFITNNTLLLWHRLYDSNRRRFQRFLARLLDEKADSPIAEIGLKINQQTGTPASVLDGFLHQSALRIAIETKCSGVAFDVQQLLNHLGAFEPGSQGYLVLLRPQKVDLTSIGFDELRRRAEAKNVLLASVTFDDVIESFRSCLMEHDEEMQELIDDFEAFCSEEDLLNTDQITIFVPPCGHSFDINVEGSLYFCPTEWSRRLVSYLGIYKAKSVGHIGIIKKVVSCEPDANGSLACEEGGVPAQVTPEEYARIKRAIENAHDHGFEISRGHKFFLCDRFCPTDFRKVSPGGIMGHRYLLLPEDLRGKDLDALANALKERTWG